MGRGVSSGGGQSSLGYLFGGDETVNNVQVANNQGVQPVNGAHIQNVNVASPIAEKQIPAGIPGCLKNNYHRADGQNCGNFLTVWPFSTFLFCFHLHCTA